MNSDAKRVPWSTLFAVLVCLLYFFVIIAGNAGASTDPAVSRAAVVSDAAMEITREPALYLFMALPFVAMHSLVVHVARHSTPWGCAILVLLAILVAASFFTGFAQYYQFLAERKWTAASLARPMAIVYSFGAIVVVAFIAELLLRRNGRHETQDQL